MNHEYISRPGEFDPLEADDSVTVIHHQKHTGKEKSANSKDPVPVLRVRSLTEILNYQPPTGAMLVGDGIIELGETALLFGPPGSYKSFAVGQLMLYGAQGCGTWLRHKINTKFASLWLNCENGPRRLKDQFNRMNLPADAADYIHVTDIPGIWNLSDPRLMLEIRREIEEKHISLLIIDTVSNFVEDEFAKQFAAFFAAINTLLHGLEPRPAVLLLHHSRKPKESDKGARGLLNLISGHQMLQRRARSICYLGRVTDDFEEKRVAAVWLKVSNNGEAEGTKTALTLAEDATLQPIEGFDWSEWIGGGGGGGERKGKVSEAHIREIFKEIPWLPLKNAATRLEAIANVGRTTAYKALEWDGRFGHLIRNHPTDEDLIGLRNIPSPAGEPNAANDPEES